MKKYLVKLFVITIIIFSLLSFKKYFTPYYLGDGLYSSKLADFQKKNKNEKFNTVFFGASVTYNHINTTLFDSLLLDQNIRSYNFATPTTTNPESFFLYKGFINSLDREKINYAFIGLTPLRKIEDYNFYITKYNYSINFHYLKFAINYVLASDYGSKKKGFYIKKYIQAFLYSFIDFKIFQNFFEINNKKNINGLGINGYYPLNTEIDQFKFNKRHNSFLSDTTILSTRRNSAFHFNNFSIDDYLNDFYLNYLKSLIEASQENDIKLIFILLPRLEDDYYKEMIPIAKALPKENIINLSNPIQYEDLYKVKFSFDADHLNSKGANIYTNFLTKEFKHLYFENK